MSQQLFGGEVSGPGTTAISEDLLTGGGRVQAASTAGLGFDASADMQAAIEALLADPGDRLQGLFAALEPFERRTTAEAVEGTREGFGQLGGRFSRNRDEAEARTRGELAGNFAKSRESSILEAGNMQAGVVAALLQALIQSRGQTLDFFRPGQANFQQGILGDLIGAAGLAGASKIGGPVTVAGG